MFWSRCTTLVPIAFLLACEITIPGDPVPSEDDGNDTHDVPGNSTGEDSSSTTSMASTTIPMTSADGSTGADTEPPIDWCNVFTDQPCPDQCTLRQDDYGQWTDPQCVAAGGERQPGEACVPHWEPGEDTCTADSVCWVSEWEVTNGAEEGLCTKYCYSDDDCPSIAGSTYQCVSVEDVPICMLECNPIYDDCAGDHYGCYWFEDTKRFLCAPNLYANQGGGIDEGDPCELPNTCASSLSCIEVDAESEIQCARPCELSNCSGSTCCDEGTLCWPPFAQPEEQVGAENIGICGYFQD